MISSSSFSSSSAFAPMTAQPRFGIKAKDLKPGESYRFSVGDEQGDSVVFHYAPDESSTDKSGTLPLYSKKEEYGESFLRILNIGRKPDFNEPAVFVKSSGVFECYKKSREQSLDSLRSTPVEAVMVNLPVNVDGEPAVIQAKVGSDGELLNIKNA